jgi:hypothetical protein
LHPGYLGVDGGAYILGAKRLLGLSLPAMDFIRPPLAPGWLLVPFLHWFGDDVGYKIWSAIFSTIPITPAAYLLARRFLSPKLALISAVFMAVNPWNWEMVVTGALPLVGIGLIFLALWGLVGIAQGKDSLPARLAIAASVGLIPYVNQTSAGLAFVSIGTFLAGTITFTKSLRPLRTMMPWLCLGAALALPALFWYQDVLPGGSRLSFPGPKVFIPHGYTAAWIITAYGWYIGWDVLRHTKDAVLKALVIVMLAHSTLPLFSSYDESIINIFFRSAHLASVLIILVGTGYVARYVSKLPVRKIAMGVAIFATILASASGYIFVKQASYSDMLTPDFTAALALIPDGQPDTIITTNFMTGLWIGAIQKSPAVWAFSTKPPPMWQETYKSEQCVFGWRTDCDPLAEARKLNAKYVLVDERFPHITKQEPNLWGAPEDTWAPTNVAPWLQSIYSKGTVRLWTIGVANNG